MIPPRLFITVCIFSILSACASSKKTSSSTTIIVDDGTSDAEAVSMTTPMPVATADNKTYLPLQHKYAGYLKVSPEEISNIQLYRFIDSWLATPYKWGGTDKYGIDCSAFMQKLLEDVYSISIPRTSIQQFFTDWIERFGSKQYLSEGDLVFFRTMDNKLISHVGLYLNNRMFINASSSKGVSIASLDDPYWKRTFVAAGRIKSSMLSNYHKSKLR
jgi:murein DD-endopeptidase / murein LD-carboxypeptidase